MSVREIVQHGWLIKSPSDSKEGIFKGFFKKTWKRRYFILTVVTRDRSSHPKEVGLRSSAPTLNALSVKSSRSKKDSCKSSNQRKLELSYYDNEKMAKKIGSIDLERCEEVLSQLNSTSFDHVFAIKTYFRGNRPRTYFLASDTEQEMMTWVNQLCKYLKMLHESTPSYNNRSSSTSNALHQIVQPLQLQLQLHRQLSIISSVTSRSTTALDGWAFSSRTPTLSKKQATIDHSDDSSLSSLPRNVTLSRMNSLSRSTVTSPYFFNAPSTNFASMPQCPPPADYHGFLPFLLGPHSTLPKSRLERQAEEKLATHDKNFTYFTQSVTHLLNLQNQTKIPTNCSNSSSSSYNGLAAATHYDAPKHMFVQQKHLYHNQISEFYDVPADKSRYLGSPNSHFYSKDGLNIGSELDESLETTVERGPESFTSLPEGDRNCRLRDLYSVPCKVKMQPIEPLNLQSNEY